MLDDVSRWRQDTPGTQTRNHLNNAGSSLMPTPVINTMLEHCALEREIGGYEAADFVADRITEVYAQVAMLVGALPRNIAIVENATTAFTQAIAAFDFTPGDRVVVSRADYVSHQLMFLAMARRQGIEVVHADTDESLRAERDTTDELIDTELSHKRVGQAVRESLEESGERKRNSPRRSTSPPTWRRWRTPRPLRYNVVFSTAIRAWSSALRRSP